MTVSFMVLAAIAPLALGQNSCQSLADNLFNGNCKSFVRPCPSAAVSTNHSHASQGRDAAPTELCMVS